MVSRTEGGAVQILSEPFATLDDYLAWAERRPAEEHCEVVDGQPIVTPSPGGRHQQTLRRLLYLLEQACPDGNELIFAPWDWVLWERPRLQLREPDLVVVTHDQARGARLTTPPLLAVEVLSPTSFERDTVAKRDDYARAGLDHYWVVDPETPQVAVYRRQGDRLAIVAHGTGDTEVRVDEPLTVRFRPSDLAG